MSTFAVEIVYRGIFQKNLAKNISRGIVLAAVNVALARLATAQAGAKPEDIAAAEANVRATQARLDQVRSGARPEEIAAHPASLTGNEPTSFAK